MKKRLHWALLGWLSLLCFGARAQTNVLLAQENFEVGTPGTNPTYGYTANNFQATSNTEYFQRQQLNAGAPAYPGTSQQVTNREGSYAWTAEGVRGTGTQTVRSAGYVVLNAVNATGYNNFSMSVAFADPAGTSCGTCSRNAVLSTDRVRLQYSFDGGPFVTAKRLVNSSGGYWQEAALPDSVGNGIIINQNFQDVTAAISGTGSSLRVRMVCDFRSPILVFDNIRVYGDVSVVATPTLNGLEPTAASYTEGGNPVQLTTSLTVGYSNGTSPNLTGGTVSVSANFASGDQLNFSNQNGISGSYNNGVLTLTGTASLAAYEMALRSITYSNTNAATLNTGTRQITFQVRNGSTVSNSPVRTLNITGGLNAAAPLPYTEDFAADRDGTRYFGNTWADVGNVRVGSFRATTSPAVYNGTQIGDATFTGQSGGYWFGESPSTTLNPTNPYSVVQLAPVNATGRSNIRFTVAIGAAGPWQGYFNANNVGDQFELFYSTDGGTTLTKFGAFYGVDGTTPARQDVDLDPLTPAAGTLLSTALQDFTFNLPASVAVSNLTFVLRQRSRAGGIELAYDNIRITATVAPTVTTTSPATSITTTSAVLGGNVTSDGGGNLTDYGVVYVAGTGTPTTSNNKVQAGTSSPGSFPASFSVNLSGLTPATTYTARAYATNSVGTSYGANVTFTTAAAAPSVTQLSPTSGPVGTSVVITGTGFTGTTAVSFNGKPTAFTVNSATQITATVAAGTTTGNVIVTTSGGSSAAAAANVFTVILPSTSVSSITTTTTSPTNASSITYTVTFAADVTGLTASNFSLSPTVAGASIGTPTVVSGSSNTQYTVTVNTGTGDGALQLNLANATGLSRGVSNIPYAVSSITIDKTAPTTTITSSTPGVSNGSTTNTTPIAFAITFPETVLNFGQGDVQVTGGTLTGFFVNSASNYTFNVTPSGSGSTVTVNVAANVANDAVGNGNTAASQYSVTYQQPLVASSQAVTVNLDANGNGTLNASSVNNGSTGGGTLTYTIQKIVYGRVAEGSTLALSTPNAVNFTSIPFAVYGSPTGTNGNYGPSTCGSPTGNGGTPGTDVRATVGSFLINRNSGTIDANNNTFGDPCSGTPKALAVQAAYSANAASLTYDCSEAGKTQYVLLTVSNGTSTSTSVAQVTVNPSPAITIADVSPGAAPRGATITVTGTNLSGVNSVTVNGATATVSNLRATGFTFVVPAAAAAGNGPLTVTAPCAQLLTASFTVQQLLTATPTITAPMAGETTNSLPTFMGTAPAGSTVTVYLINGGPTTTVGTTTATGGTFSLTPAAALAGGNYRVYATAQTSGSAVSPTSGSVTFTVDTTPPIASSSTRQNPTTVNTNATALTYRVTFSEAVTGVTAGSFTFTAVTGVVTGTIASVAAVSSSYGTQFDVTVNNLNGIGAVRLDVKSSGSGITDLVGNPLNGGLTNGEYYNLLAPVTATLTQRTPSPTATATLTYRVTFSDGVTGLNPGNFSVANAGTTVSGATVASVAAVSGSTTTYDVVVNAGTGNGTLVLQLVNSTGVTPSVSSLPVSGPSYTIKRSFAASPTLRIQGVGSPSNLSDVTAFVDLVQALRGTSGTAAFANGLRNGSFETNNVSTAPGSFLYQSQGVVASPWTFGTQAGVSRNTDSNNSGFGSFALDGTAVAFLQSQSATGNNGSVAQPLTVPTGSYRVSFRTAQRTNSNTPNDQVVNTYLFDGLNTVFLGSIQPSDNGFYQTFTSAAFDVTAPDLVATVSTSATNPTSTAPIPFAVSFTNGSSNAAQSVGTSFTASDVTVAGGLLTSGSFSGSGAGPYTFTVTPSGFGTVSVSLAANAAQDDNNTGNLASNTLSVQFAAPTITLAPTTLLGGTRGTAYSQTLTASGGTAPYSYAITAGALPAGLLLNLSNGTIAGTPAASGSFTFTVTATDASSAPGPYTGARSYTLTVAAPTVTVAPATLPNGAVATTYSQTITASGGMAPYAYAITAGALPAGLTLTNGTIAGTPTAGGSFTFVVTATDASTSGSGGPYAGSRSYTLTVAAPTIVLSPATLPGGTQVAAYSQTLTASGGTAPYTYALTGALPNGVSLTNGTLAGTPTASGTFNFTVTATDASTGTGPYTGARSYTLVIAAPTLTLWTGTTSTDWFTASNWTAGVPTAGVDATIPALPSGGRFPFITANAPANARNLSIDANASLTMTTNTLILAGSLTNNGSFNGFSGSNGGTLVLGGSALSLLNGGGVSRFWNLTVGASGAQLNNPNVTSVRRLLLLNGNFAANGNPFTLISDAANTAMVVNNGSAVVTGNATVQRYIDPTLNSNLGYRHVSPAIGNATVNSLTTGSYSPVVNPAYNTSPTPLLVSNFPTVYGYAQTRLTTTSNNLNLFDKGWYSPNTTTDALSVGRGYTVLIGGGQTWNFTGPLNNGDVAVNVTRSSNDAAAGYNLLGNPYPSPLDWSQVTQTGLQNVNPTLYVYRSNDPTNPYTGVYDFYNNGVGTIANGVVPQGQGFFVQVASGQTAGAVTFRNAQRPTTYQNPTYQRSTAETRPLVELHLQGTGSPLRDAAFVYFEQAASDAFDAQYDAEKLPNPSGLNLSTSLSATQRLAIDGRAPLGTAQRVVPLAVGVPAAGSYTLTAAQLLNLGTTPVYLRDLQSGAVIDLRTQPSYSFTVSNASAPITGRFELVFSPQAPLATAPAALAAQVGVYPNPATGTAFVELPAALGRAAVAAELVDALGRTVRTQALPVQGAAPHRLSLADLATGVYTLHLRTSAGVIVKKMVVE